MSGLRPRSAFEIANGLHWVRGEIDTSLARARSAIELYVESSSDGAADPQRLQTAADELRLVRGSLAMIECFGAGMLAQEMLQLLDALIAGQAQHPDEAFAALSGATLQLSDYVDLLVHGAADRVLVLQPVVNELRLAGGRPLSTEAELFARQLQRQAAPASTQSPGRSGASQALAQRELMSFQNAFLHWFRGQQIDAALGRIGKIADSVAVNAEAPSLREFWSGCAALAECLRQQGQDTLDLKRLYGRAVSQLKLLAEGGEAAALAQLGDAPQQVLFHIARSPAPTRRAADLIAGLRLDVLLPSLAQITDLRRRLRGPNTTILNRVYAEIRRDFSQLKDAIDLAVRTHGRTSADLGGTRERLRRMAQTVGALGLPGAQAALLNQAGIVAELPPGAPQWVDTATAILRVEHSLEEALFRALGRAGEAASRNYAEIAAEVPHGQDLRESIAALVRECLVEFSQLKAAVDLYLKGGEPAALLQAPQRLHDISAALNVLGQQRASEILAELQHYVAEGRLAASKNEPGLVERFADAVSSAEVFFEALRDGLPSPERVLDDVAAYVGRLRENEIEIAAATPAAAALTLEIDPRSSREPFAGNVEDDAPAAAIEPIVVAAPAPVSAPVGEGIDPEIRDIFIDEAGEVLLELQRSLPLLKRDPANREVLADARRAFHTLKGSGRMAGALRIGEFSWAIEDLLNRCLNGALALRPPVLELLDDATRLLPKLIANFRSGGADDADTAGVVERAAQLAAGGSDSEPGLLAVFRDDARDRLSFVRRWLEAQKAAERLAVEPEIVRAFHTLRGSAAVVQAQGIQGLAAALENYLNSVRARGQALPASALVLLADALTTINAWLDGTPASAAQVAALADWRSRIEALLSEPAAAMVLTPAVDEAFCGQALDTLQALESQVMRWSQMPALSAAIDLRAGFAALGARAEQAAATPIATVLQAVANRLVEWNAGPAPGAGFFATLLELFEGLYQQLDAYRDGTPAADTDYWLSRVQTLARPAPAQTATIDAELHEIFSGEAAELLELLDRQQSRWAQGDPTAVPGLQRGLHTLKGSARTAGVFAIGEVAQQLEYELERLDTNSVAPLQSRVAKGIEGLHRLFGNLLRGEPLDATGVLDEIGRTARYSASAPPPAELPSPDKSSLQLPPMAALSLDQAAASVADADVPDFVATIPPAETLATDFEAMPIDLGERSAPPIESVFAESTSQTPAAAFAEPPAAAARTLDPELTDIFSAEAGELLEQLDIGFEAWQNGQVPGRGGDQESDALRDVQRALHTLKGGARMLGLDAMGDAAHLLESQVNAVTASGEFPEPSTFRQLRDALDGLQRMHDKIRRGEAELLVAPGEVPLPEAADIAPAGLSGWLPELFWRPQQELDPALAARRETARVPVETLDAMLNEAGEISIYRSRLEERNSGVRTQLAEMAQTIARVRDQLRMMEFETEAQIAARGLSAGAAEIDRAADRYGPDFDPLEMDRFSRMQELSRALAESVNDLASLQTTMIDAVRETETLLLQQSRINSEVQQGLMGTLMVPFSRQVQRLLRVVRQTAQENGKQADIRFSGADAELDRKVLERITAPLEHLLRNAVVHGIEDPALRALANKPLIGSIDVKLHREGSQLLVEVSDDGAGLDLVAIRDKAIERGLLAPQAQLSDDELARFIFEPGFSTAKSLTQDAGRGIGMDVVVSEVKQLGGTLELRSEAGQGARFLLRLPLTLAMSQALMFGIGHETYALPLPSVEGIARIPRADFDNLSRADGPLYAYGGRGYRVRHLADYLELPRSLNADARSLTAILVRLGDDLGSGERRVALVIDQLLGNRDIVTKAIGPQISSVPGVAGATLLADGRVVLILDVPALVAEHARRALLSDAAAATPPTRSVDVLDTVMVVDDSVTMRRVAERLLLRNGYRVVTARDGLDAIAQLQTETPVVLLLDIEMPRADGFEVATFVRNNPRLRAVPIIMITSRSGEKHRERARALGVDRYLIKPYQEDQLLAEISLVRAVHAA